LSPRIAAATGVLLLHHDALEELEVEEIDGRA
jgi:hypothetical protein